MARVQCRTHAQRVWCVRGVKGGWWRGMRLRFVVVTVIACVACTARVPGCCTGGPSLPLSAHSPARPAALPLPFPGLPRPSLAPQVVEEFISIADGQLVLQRQPQRQQRAPAGGWGWGRWDADVDRVVRWCACAPSPCCCLAWARTACVRTIPPPPPTPTCATAPFALTRRRPVAPPPPLPGPPAPGPRRTRGPCAAAERGLRGQPPAQHHPHRHARILQGPRGAGAAGECDDSSRWRQDGGWGG